MEEAHHVPDMRLDSPMAIAGHSSLITAVLRSSFRSVRSGSGNKHVAHQVA